LLFLTGVLRSYLDEQNIDHLTSMMKRAGITDSLIEFFPPNKRQEEYLIRHFELEGLKSVLDFYKKSQGNVVKEITKAKLVELIQAGKSQGEVGKLCHAVITNCNLTPQLCYLLHYQLTMYLKQQVTANSWTEFEAVSLIWDAILASIEYSSRAEQMEGQVVKAVTSWSKAMEYFCQSPKTEISLLQKVQVNCYDDARLMKLYRVIVTNFYKYDIVSKAAVLYWFEKGAASQGKAVFLKQVEPFVEWLNNEEDDDDDEEDDE
jgi:hypothetical protein